MKSKLIKRTDGRSCAAQRRRRSGNRQLNVRGTMKLGHTVRPIRSVSGHEHVPRGHLHDSTELRSMPRPILDERAYPERLEVPLLESWPSETSDIIPTAVRPGRPAQRGNRGQNRSGCRHCPISAVPSRGKTARHAYPQQRRRRCNNRRRPRSRRERAHRFPA